MEESIPPRNSDPELTRTVISDSPSSSSAVVLKTFAHATPGTATEWTNEKHRSYINSLETSFVDKLYNSRRLRDCNPQKYVQGTHPSQELLPVKMYNSSDQSNVVRHRRSQKVISPRNENLLESTADSNVSIESRRMDHNVSCYKGTHLRTTARTLEQNPACRWDSVGSTTEVSGQNFVDELHRGKLSCESIPKRLKRPLAYASGNDQLVPLGNFDTKEVSMAHYAPSEGEEQGHHQLLLESKVYLH